MEPSEGRSLKDLCKDNIGFKFQGFRVEGQVSTFGSDDGPSGVKINLVKNKEVVQTIDTTDNGKFAFKPVYPGKYTIEPTENLEIFDKSHSELKIEVKKDSNNFYPRALVVKGYAVSGTVQSAEGPVEKATVLIFSEDGALTQDYKCTSEIFETYRNYAVDDRTPFCAASTDKEGNYTFKNIPFGSFFLSALKESEVVSYYATPSTIPVEVRHSNITVSNAFSVSKFSIKGKVTNSLNEGVPDVIIKLDGQEVTKTNSAGEYILEDMSASNYDIEAEAANMYLEPLTNINLNPKMTVMPPIPVTHYRICGVIMIECT